MVNYIVCWSKETCEVIAKFSSDYNERNLNNVPISHTKHFVMDVNNLTDSSAMHYHEALVLSIAEADKSKIMKKIENVFKDFKKTA